MSRSGPRDAALRPGLLYFGPPGANGAAMSDLVHFIVLSLFPTSLLLQVAEQLRAGDAPAAIANRFFARYWRDEPDHRAASYDRANAAIARADSERLTPIVWSDAAYPAALTTIADPPPMLWIRGAPA